MSTIIQSQLCRKVMKNLLRCVIPNKKTLFYIRFKSCVNFGTPYIDTKEEKKIRGEEYVCWEKKKSWYVALHVASRRVGFFLPPCIPSEIYPRLSTQREKRKNSNRNDIPRILASRCTATCLPYSNQQLRNQLPIPYKPALNSREKLN